MIKVYKLKTILKMIVLISLTIIGVVILLKYIVNNGETVMTSSNSASSYKILVDVENSKLFLFENDTLIKTYKCSGGKWSTPSPIGTWTIVSKAKWGEGFGRKLDGIKCSLG